MAITPDTQVVFDLLAGLGVGTMDDMLGLNANDGKPFVVGVDLHWDSVNRRIHLSIDYATVITDRDMAKSIDYSRVKLVTEVVVDDVHPPDRIG